MPKQVTAKRVAIKDDIASTEEALANKRSNQTHEVPLTGRRSTAQTLHKCRRMAKEVAGVECYH
jgi:hypothetical protein